MLEYAGHKCCKPLAARNQCIESARTLAKFDPLILAGASLDQRMLEGLQATGTATDARVITATFNPDLNGAGASLEQRTLEGLRSAAAEAEEAMWGAARVAAAEYARNTGQSLGHLGVDAALLASVAAAAAATDRGSDYDSDDEGGGGRDAMNGGSGGGEMNDGRSSSRDATGGDAGGNVEGANSGDGEQNGELEGGEVDEDGLASERAANEPMPVRPWDVCDLAD